MENKLLQAASKLHLKEEDLSFYGKDKAKIIKKIDSLKKIKNLKDDELRKYYEDIAREDLDYLKNGERVFVNVSGD